MWTECPEVSKSDRQEKDHDLVQKTHLVNILPTVAGVEEEAI